jgi:hypothetical protein
VVAVVVLQGGVDSPERDVASTVGIGPILHVTVRRTGSELRSLD